MLQNELHIFVTRFTVALVTKMTKKGKREWKTKALKASYLNGV